MPAKTGAGGYFGQSAKQLEGRHSTGMDMSLLFEDKDIKHETVSNFVAGHSSSKGTNRASNME